MRDALSLLDQCIAFYLGQKLTYDKVLEVLGAVDVEVFNRLMTHIAAKKIPGYTASVHLNPPAPPSVSYFRDSLLKYQAGHLHDPKP